MIDVTDITTLDPALVKEREAVLIQMLTEAFPSLDFSQGGILQQLVANPNAVLDVVTRTEIQNLINSMSLQTIAANPSIADPTIVDAAMSNYMLTRTAATSVQGVVAIVLDVLSSVNIPTTINFTVNGRTFNPVANYIAVTNSALVIDDTTRLIQQRTDGRYWFTINVIENVTGGQLVAQLVQFAVDPQPSSFYQAYAANDFPAGLAAEDNAALIAKVETGITTKAMSDRKSITNLLKTEFPTITDMSIIGYGDFEMTRDRANLFGIGVGSKADVYVRLGALPAVTKVTVMAVPVAAGPYVPALSGTGNVIMGTQSGPVIFEIPIMPTMIPGFYRAEKVTTVDPLSEAVEIPGLYEPLDRGIYRPTGEQFMPFISTAVQARFSKYQGNALIRLTDAMLQEEHYATVSAALAGVDTIPVYYKGVQYTLQVRTTPGSGVDPSTTILGVGNPIDPNNPVVLGSEVGVGGSGYQSWLALTGGGSLGLIGLGWRFYDVYLSGITGLSDLQNYLNDRQHQAPAGDYLVKGATPCFVGANITIGYKAGTQPPDISAMQSAVATAINAVTFDVADLQASAIINYVTGILNGAGYVIMPLTLTGEIDNPDGTITNLNSSNSLVIPNDAVLGVSRRTVAYYAYPEDINITLTSVSSWSV